MLLLDFSYLSKAIVVLAWFVFAAWYYLQKSIEGFNGDILGAVEQISEMLLLFYLMDVFA